MNLLRQEKNSVFIERSTMCDRLSTRVEVRWAMEFFFQSGLELDHISNGISNVKSEKVGTLIEKLAWATFRDGNLRPKNN
jgi:hypothetical protein